MHRAGPPSSKPKMSPQYPNRNTSDDYTGPSVKEMLATHTLAKEIIARHNDPCPIFDDENIAFLGEFVADPTAAQSLLEARGLTDEEKVRNSRSLVAHVVARHGTENPALTDEELATLKQWFESGGARTD